MIRLWHWTAVFCAVLASIGQAQNSPVVVELFTSQGCSSCPPADELLTELAERDDVIALGLHVDYWDYIGWKDRFAQGQFTRRQKGYAQAGGWHRIYTPQMVVNGVHDVVGSRPMKVAELIQKHAMAPPKARLSVQRKGGHVVVGAETLVAPRPCDVFVVRYKPAEMIEIRRGENAGRRLTYTNIVLSWDKVAGWDGKGVFQKEIALDGEAPLVILLQEPRYGAILAAARLN